MKKGSFSSLRGETMASPLASWSLLLFQFSLLLLCSARGREVPVSKSKDADDLDAFDITEQAVDDHVWTYAKQSKETPSDGSAGAPVIDQKEEVDDVYRFYDKKPSDQGQVAGRRRHRETSGKKSDTDPSLHVFFTARDLRIGNTMPLYFPARPDPSKSPRLLPREEAESIPFSSSRLDRLLDYFSFSKGSPQAKAMEYTLEQCELEPIEGEVKFCATSLEAMLDQARRIFGPRTETRAMTTTYLSMSSTANPLKNYTIVETPEQVPAPRMIGCHPMPYPYAVFYCHCQLRSENRLYRVSLGGPNGERVEATAVCHMDTSKWDADHVSFRVLGIKPGSAAVCHFFPVDNLVWVPGQSDHV